MRARLGGPGEVVSVRVHARPAVKLLWGRADRVVVRLRRFDARELDLAGELEQAGRAGELEAHVEHVLGPHGLVLRDALLRVRDGELAGEATVDPDDLAALLPAGVEAHPIATGDGAVALEGRAELFGRRTAIRLRVVVDRGRVVVRPEHGLLAALVTWTAFAEERVAVASLTAAPLPDGRFRYRATARIVAPASPAEAGGERRPG